DPRAKVRHIAAHRLHGAEFADVADRALAGWHEQAARTVQVVPLGLVLAVAVEHLHAMVLAVGHIHPARSITSSASASSVGGTVEPSAFAVVRFYDEIELRRLRIHAPIPPSGTCAASADYPAVACL